MKTALGYCLLTLLVSLPIIAQTSPASGDASAIGHATSAQKPVATKSLFTEALAYRSEVVAAINAGEKVPALLARVKSHHNASGLLVDADVDFAYAAINIGEKLVACRKYAEAELFFREAEAAFEKLVEKTPDTQAATKASFFANLGVLRVSYLGKTTEGKAAFEAAIVLQPDDKHLKQQRDYRVGEVVHPQGAKGDNAATSGTSNTHG